MVIDSIAAPFRGEYDFSREVRATRHALVPRPDASAHPFRVQEMIRRSRVLSTIAASMKRLSEEFRTCFVVTNQVRTSAGLHCRPGAELCAQVSSVLGARWQPAGMTNKLRILGGAALPEKLHELAPALGLTWAHCVNTRCVLLQHCRAARR